MHAPVKIGGVLLLLLALQGHVLGCSSPEFDDGGPECVEAAQTFCVNNKNATDCWLMATPDYTWESKTYRVNCSGQPAYGNEPAWQEFGRVTSYMLDGREAYGAGTGLNFIMFPRKVTRLSMRRYCLEALESANFRAFVFLARLELRESRVGVVQQYAFDGLSALTELQLIGNEFGTGMHPDSLRWLGYRLQQLDVRSCAGVNFRLGHLRALTMLHMADSSVVDLNEMIHPVPESLMHLTLINVRSEVSPSLFLGTTAGGIYATVGSNLRHVVVVGCSLRYVFAGNMPLLKVLNISGNGLVDGMITMRNLPLLERLFATHNKLTKITANMFNVGPTLGFVDLSDNQIVYINGCAFGPNHRIIRLVLSGNPLIVADPQFRLPDAPMRCRDHRNDDDDDFYEYADDVDYEPKEDHHRPEVALETTTTAGANFSSRSMASIFDDSTVQEESPTVARAGKGMAGNEVMIAMLGIFYLLV